MAKAKLTTRGISSSTVTSDNLAKGSQLTHNQLDSNFINLRDATFGVVADDSSTIQIGMDNTLYVQGSGGITTATDSAGVLTIDASSIASSSLGDLTAVGSTLSSPSNADITLDPSGTGLVVVNTNLTVGNNSTQRFLGNIQQHSAGDNLQLSTTAHGSFPAGSGIQIAAREGTLVYGRFEVTNGPAAATNFQDGLIRTDTIEIGGGNAIISGRRSNEDLSLQPAGTGNLILGAVKLNGTTLSSDDSTKITIAEAVDVTGALVAGTSLNIAGDGATVTGILDEDAMGSDSNVKLATQQSIKAYVDAQDANIASDTLTFTNKTFDADGTGNNLTNIEVANFKSGVLDTDISSVAGTDTTLASAKAIKTYVDSQVSGVTAGQGFKVVGDDSASVDIAEGGTVYIQGGTNVTTTTDSAGVVTINAADNSLSLIDEDGFGTNSATRPPSQQSVKAYVDAQDANIASDTLTLTNKTFDAEGTGNSLSNVDVANLKSGVLDTDISSVSGSDDTLASAKAIKTYVDSQVSGVATGQGFKVIGDDSAGVDIPEAGTLYIQGGTNVTTATDSAGVVTINATAGGSGDIEGVTAGNGLTGGGTTGTVTLNVGAGTGIDVASDAISVDVSDFLTNGSDNRIVTATGADAMNGEANLTFDGSTLAVTGAATVSTTLGVTGASTLDGVTITDNHISSNRSNDNIVIEANGTGQVELGVPFDQLRSNSRYNYGVNKAYVNGSYDGATRIIANSEGIKATATQTTSSTNFQLMAENRTELEMAGFSFTSANEGRGLRAKQYNCVVGNDNSSTASTIGVVTAVAGNVTLFTGNGDLTATNVKCYRATLEGEPGSGKTATFTTGYNFHGKGPVDLGEGGTTAGTNYYGLYIDTGSVATNNYGVWINDDSYTNKLGGVTLAGGTISTDGISIVDNEITASRSNDNLEISANGTGFVEISSEGTFSDQASAGYLDSFGSPTRCRGVHIFRQETIGSALTSSSDRRQGHLIAQDYTLANYSSSDKDNRYRTQTVACSVDLKGATVNSTNTFAGAMGAQGQVAVHNSDASNAGTIGNTIGMMAGSYHYSAQTVNVTNAHGILSYVEQDDGGGAVTITNAYAYKAQLNKYSGTMTNGYAYYIQTNDATNKYGFYDNTASLSRFGAVILANVSDPSGVTDSSHIYAKDDGSSSEVHVRDEAGNITKISPHNKNGEWEYFSRNIKTGKTVRVNMERMIRKLEEVTGETFIETV